MSRPRIMNYLNKLELSQAEGLPDKIRPHFYTCQYFQLKYFAFEKNRFKTTNIVLKNQHAVPALPRNELSGGALCNSAAFPSNGSI